MPKLPIAVAIANEYVPDKKNQFKFTGMLLGSPEAKEGFLKSLDMESNATDFMNTIGFGQNKFKSTDGSEYPIQDIAGAHLIHSFEKIGGKKLQYVLLFDADSVRKLANESHAYTVYGINYDNAVSTVSLVPATPALEKATQKSVDAAKTKKLFNDLLPRISEKLEVSLDEKNTPEEKKSSPNVKTLFNAIPIKPIEKESNMLADWNRVDPNYTPLYIDGVLIQDLVKKQRNLRDVPDPLFADIETLKEFLKTNLLKNVKPNYQNDALQVLTATLHQGAWQRPMAAAAFDALTKDTDFRIGPLDAMRNTPDDIVQKRVTNFKTNSKGFSINDEVIQTKCAYTSGDDAGDMILPDRGNDFIYDVKVEVILDFTRSLDEGPWPKISLGEQSVKFGNKEVQGYLEKPSTTSQGFMGRIQDNLSSLFNISEEKPSPRP